MKIYIFGNEDLGFDSAPLKMVPDLRAKFPRAEFVVQDPNEEWENVPENFVMIDTVKGIKEVTYFGNLEKFLMTPRVSMHDFDALTNIQLLKKLGKIKTVRVIGVPMNYTDKNGFSRICELVDKIG
jgi:hypothetical protein